MTSGTIKNKSLLLFIVICTVFSTKTTLAQSSDVLAKSTYLQAEENFKSKKFKTTIKYLDKTVDYLGESNARIEALYVKTYNALKDFIEAEKHLASYFEMADESRQDYMEMVKITSLIKEKTEEITKRIQSKKNMIKHELENFLSKNYFVEVTSGIVDVGKNSGNPYSNPVKNNIKVNSFKIAKTEVTVGLYLAYCEETKIKPHEPYDNLSNDFKINEPVSVSWYQSIAFCEWASKKLNKKITLPTDAQWEFAARGGNKSLGYKYAGSNYYNEIAWWKENSGNRIHSVAKLKPNELGIYDMNGNLPEWTLSESRFKTAKGETLMRVYGGGYRYSSPMNIADASSHTKEAEWYKIGFRVVSY